MKIVIPGGTGQIGVILTRHYQKLGHQVLVLSRKPQQNGTIAWDGRNLGPWISAIEGADVVVNLAGRTVDCRYTEANLQQMMASRVDSTQVIGRAIGEAKKPPRLWLQMSTATIYAHRFDAPNDEHSGIIGGSEPDAPAYWARSIDIAKAWEKALGESHLPDTRRVALRTAMLMSPDKGGVFDVLRRMTLSFLAGPIAGGRQYVSWIHHEDFCSALDYLIGHHDIDGAVNICSPNPLPQKEFMAQLRRAVRVPFGLPAAAWMAEVGAFFLRTDTELILKSRRVVPKRLIDAGFTFRFSNWTAAVQQLCSQAET